MPGRRWLRRLMLAGALWALAGGVAAGGAAGNHHLMRISEVSAGVSGNQPSAYVELQMFAPGQNAVAGEHIKTYDAAGTQLRDFTFGGPSPPNPESQRTVVVAGSAGMFGPTI